MPVAELKRELSQVLDAAENGESTIVERRGKPVAVVAPFRHDRDQTELPVARRPGGILALAGLFADWESMADDMAAIIADRTRVVDRPPLPHTSAL